MDNLMSPSKSKVAPSASRPSMNQLAQSSTPITSTTQSTPLMSSAVNSSSFSSGPNYNVNTSAFTGHPQARVPMSGMGMQPAMMGMPGTGMGMQTGGMGMNYGGGMGTGYGGMGYPQQQRGPGMGSQFQPGFGGGMMGTQMNTGMQQYQRPF